MSPHETVSTEVQTALAIVKTLVLLVGSAVTYLSYSAYRRTGDRSLAMLAVGFGLITGGTLLAGFTFELLGVPLGVGIVLESVFVLAGLSVIAYSLRVR